ncbi:MAG: sulfurtransferase TusA family protein [Gammaproteobacteria bacterium]|nr:sulfurtransferase TusA family protein [Gammaproteobacteria bacterium]
MNSDVQLDAKGLNCPLPILKAKKTLKGMEAGKIIEIISTDPGSVADFEAFCRTTGNELLESSSSDGIFTYYIKKT